MRYVNQICLGDDYFNHTLNIYKYMYKYNIAARQYKYIWAFTAYDKNKTSFIDYNKR